jgi:hypothetical protein
MRQYTILFIAIAALPALADTPASDAASAIPTYEEFQAEVQGLSPDEIRALMAKERVVFVRPPPAISLYLASKCYYIQQVNKNLQKPKDKPELVPLADSSETELLNPANPNCLSDSIVRKAVPE